MTQDNSKWGHTDPRYQDYPDMDLRYIPIDSFSNPFSLLVMKSNEEFSTTVAPQDTLGWHLRPAGLLVSIANMFESEIMVKCGRRIASAKSLLGVLTLGAERGTRLYVSARGRDAQTAIKAIKEKFSAVSDSGAEPASPVSSQEKVAKPKGLVAITFKLKAQPSTQKVFLAGDFNSWDSRSEPMTRRGEQFSKSVKLAPGRYQYKYVIDGEWTVDHEAPVVISDLGTMNNVINV